MTSGSGRGCPSSPQRGWNPCWTDGKDTDMAMRRFQVGASLVKVHWAPGPGLGFVPGFIWGEAEIGLVVPQWSLPGLVRLPHIERNSKVLLKILTRGVPQVLIFPFSSGPPLMIRSYGCGSSQVFRALLLPTNTQSTFTMTINFGVISLFQVFYITHRDVTFFHKWCEQPGSSCTLETFCY